MKFLLSLSPFARVVAALALGVLTGLFVGEPAGRLDLLGKAYVRLLQMTVLPYILVSTVGGLGRLDARMARKIGLRGGGLIVFLWLTTMLTILFLPLAYPDWTAAAFFSSSLVAEAAQFDLLTLYLPANPFFSLANTIVPAVVLFSILLGAALVTVPEKRALLDSMSSLGDALMRIASFVAKLAPIGIFAIAASAAGTLRLEELGRLQVYLWVYLAAWLLLTFFTLPLFVARTSPITYREVLRVARVAMITAFATGTVLVVLPMISERCKALLAERGMDGDETDSAVDVLVPTAYSFPSVGTLLGLAFVLFAAWFVGAPLSLAQYPAFTVVGALSAFGTMAVALPFLLDNFNLPADLFQLYLLGSVVTARFATALAAMHGVVVCLLVASVMTGRMSWRRLLQVLAATLVLAAVLMASLGFIFTRTIPYQYTGDVSFESMRLAVAPVDTVPVEEPEPLSASEAQRPRLDVIRERGSLRIGYLPDRLPFAFRNNANEVVGYDLDLMHALARDLGLRLAVVRLGWDDVDEWLRTGRVDILIGGIGVTPGRAARFAFTHSYSDQTLAFIVADHRRDEFSDLATMRKMNGLRVAVPKTRYYEERLRAVLPNAEIVKIDSPRLFLRGQIDDVDALAYSAETGSAWTLIYPNFSVVVPRDLRMSFPVGFGLPRGQPDFRTFLNTWLDLKEKNGVSARLHRHWILGEGQGGDEPRWSVMHDVLHWTE